MRWKTGKRLAKISIIARRGELGGRNGSLWPAREKGRSTSDLSFLVSKTRMVIIILNVFAKASRYTWRIFKESQVVLTNIELFTSAKCVLHRLNQGLDRVLVSPRVHRVGGRSVLCAPPSPWETSTRWDRTRHSSSPVRPWLASFKQGSPTVQVDLFTWTTFLGWAWITNSSLVLLIPLKIWKGPYVEIDYALLTTLHMVKRLKRLMRKSWHKFK